MNILSPNIEFARYHKAIPENIHAGANVLAIRLGRGCISARKAAMSGATNWSVFQEV